ncbi:hypothetical protein AYI68_g4485 [Smittium mucronatum]|uniref:Uncharacterized protein n=1 Tax=Smittium mucronatum TaxID=133383 RepID=A0A1R0GWZ6_9FUNG|nr:hypothetical protein AYI68_g4485 [Smittium mucronatum]
MDGGYSTGADAAQAPIVVQRMRSDQKNLLDVGNADTGSFTKKEPKEWSSLKPDNLFMAPGRESAISVHCVKSSIINSSNPIFDQIIYFSRLLKKLPATSLGSVVVNFFSFL